MVNGEAGKGDTPRPVDVERILGATRKLRRRFARFDREMAVKSGLVKGVKYGRRGGWQG